MRPVWFLIPVMALVSAWLVTSSKRRMLFRSCWPSFVVKSAQTQGLIPSGTRWR